MGNPTYLASDAKLPYCRGCGHALVVRQLSRALERLSLPPRSVVLTTDIGCVGLSDSLFPYLHTVHTTHGRSTAMATGMALAEAVLPATGLKPIVMIGDGGAMIGLLHLVHAAQLNVDVTVLVHNNFLFGMTGGQQSALTPLNWITATTPEGNSIPPLDLLALLRTAHAGFLARQFATDSDLGDVIADAIAFPGFALIEILEICTSYGGLKSEAQSRLKADAPQAPRKRGSIGNVLREVAARQGYAMGRLEDDRQRPTFAAVYRRQIESSKPVKENANPAPPISSFQFPVSRLQGSRKLHMVIAGTAGERVQSSAALLCRAALSVAFYTTQKNDNPVTQGSGFSLSEICLSSQSIDYTGMETVDVVIAVSQDGWNELQANGTLAQLKPSTLLLLDTELEISNPTGRLIRQPFRRDATPKRAALAAIAFWLSMDPVLPNAAWDAVLASLPVERREDVSMALRVGKELASQGGACAA
jgi:pyruvate/2-oxoacid:ferredoxin oxidoreductase beta subunit